MKHFNKTFCQSANEFGPVYITRHTESTNKANGLFQIAKCLGDVYFWGDESRADSFTPRSASPMKHINETR